MARVAFFQKLSEHELAQIAAISKRHKFNGDHVVFFEGSRSDSLYLIVSGSVKIYQEAQDGREKILRVLTQLPRFGFFLGPFGPVFSGRWPAKALFYRIDL